LAQAILAQAVSSQHQGSSLFKGQALPSWLNGFWFS